MADDHWMTDDIQLGALLLRTDSAEAARQATAADVDFVRLGSTGKPGRPVHVLTRDARSLRGGRNSTLCSRSTDATPRFGPDSEITCRICARRLAALRGQAAPR